MRHTGENEASGVEKTHSRECNSGSLELVECENAFRVSDFPGNGLVLDLAFRADRALSYE